VKLCQDFESRYEIDQDWESYGGQGGGRKFFYPGGLEAGGKDGLVVRVVPLDGEAWVGSFAPGSSQYGLAGQVMSCPDPREVCVISSGAGYIVRADDPSNWKSIRAIPVCDALAIPAKKLLVLSDFTKLFAYGADGLKWESPQVSSDGIRIVGNTQEHLDLIAWDASGQMKVEILLNLDNGSVLARSPMR
jgi:hypothetical protein